MKYNVLIAESNHPDDYYQGRLDGQACASLLSTIEVDNVYKIALDGRSFEKAVWYSIRYNYTVLHISCHGDGKGRGLILCDRSYITWDELTELFDRFGGSPRLLTLSSCGGGNVRLPKEFIRNQHKPEFIIGSAQELPFSDFCTANSILYYSLHKGGGLRRSTASAIRRMNASVGNYFRRWRWSSSSNRYIKMPKSGTKYKITT